MISKDELVKVAKNTELTLYQQEKEYLLKLFLFYYYKHFEDAVFKGGTAIRFAMGLDRFSEDLDFNIKNPEKFKGQVNDTLRRIDDVGISNYFIDEEMFEKSYTCEIAFQGPLYNGDKKSRNKFRIDAGIRMPVIQKPRWQVIKSEYPETKERFLVRVMDFEEILCEKIRTLFQRNRGRDLYDVWFLLNSDVEINEELLKKKIKKLNKNDFTTKKEYEQDLEHLVSRVVSYKQVKYDVLERLEEYLNL